MAKNKDTNLYTLQLTAGEVKAIGSRRYLKKVMWKMILFLVWMLLWLGVSVVTDSEVLGWIGIVPTLAYYCWWVIAMNKAENQFYKEVKGKHHV